MVARNTPPRWQTAIVVIVILGLAGFLIWCVERVGQLFWDYLSHADPTIGAAIIAAAGTILVSVLSTVLARFFERRKELAMKRQEIEHEIREKHMPTYQKLIQFLFKIFRASKKGVKVSEDEIIDFFDDFTQEILVWGSDQFTRDFSAFREALLSQTQQQQGGQPAQPDVIKTMVVLETLLYTIRADCGHANKGLGNGDLLTFFINDIRDYIPKEQVILVSNSNNNRRKAP